MYWWVLRPLATEVEPPEAFKVPATNELTASQVSVLRFLHKICSDAEKVPAAIPVIVTPLPANKVREPLLILAMLIVVPMGYATLLLGGMVIVAELVLSMVTTFPASDSTQV